MLLQPRADGRCGEMKLELYNFLPRPDPGGAHRPGHFTRPRQPPRVPTYFHFNNLAAPPPSPHPQTSTWPMMSWPPAEPSLQCCRLYTCTHDQTGLRAQARPWWRKGAMLRTRGPSPVLLEASPCGSGCQEGGEWSLAVPSCSRCNELRGTVQRFGECNSKHFKVFISAKLCRAAASRCNVTPGRGGG